MAGHEPVTSLPVLVLDDDPVLAELTARTLVRHGYRPTVISTPTEAIALAETTTFALLLTDIHLQGTSGLEIAGKLRAGQPDMVAVAMTGDTSLDLAIEAIQRGMHGFVVKPFTPAQLILSLESAIERARLERENLRLRLLAPMLEDMVRVLAVAIDMRDAATGAHGMRLLALADTLARSAGLDALDREAIRHAALVHDIGKIAVLDRILRKPGPLDEAERREMELHPRVGADMIATVEGLRGVAPIVLHHHERWDGRGYPDGLAAEAIPIGARLLAVVDTYDAMTSHRPYRRARPADEARRELRRAAGTQLDPWLVERFLRTFPEDTSAST